jgi:hypothetical protein
MNKHLTILLLGTACSLGPAAAALTPAETSAILYLKQEEKLARDVYQALSAQWGQRPFASITASEQRHLSAVDGLIRRFGVQDSTPAAPGQFSIPELQALYDALILQGSQSLANALAVGVLIEETDIADLDELLAAARDRTVRQVMTHLRQGSYQHLAAFNAALAPLMTSGNTAGSAAGSCTPPSVPPRPRGRR